MTAQMNGLLCLATTFPAVVNKRIWPLQGLLLILALTTPTPAATVTLRPAADTSIIQVVPGSNLGNTALATGTTKAGQKTRALIKFNPGTNVPPGSVVTSVQLTLQVVKAPPAAVNVSFGLYRVLVNWGEGTGGTPGATALTRNPAAKAGEANWTARLAPSTLWSSPGAAAPTDYVAASSATALSVRSGAFTFASTPQLIADVQSWIDNPGTNFGWILICGAEGTIESARRISSRETASTAPSLVVTFTNAPAATPPAISSQPQSLTVLPGENAAFSVTASGSSPLSYQWSLNQAVLAGFTNATLSLAGVQAVNAGSYTVTITNTAGAVTSTPAILSLAPLPAILAAKPVAGSLNLSFPIVARHNYAVQFRDSLSAGGWLGLTNFNASTSANTVVSDALSASQRFYRLQVTPSP